jgi:two-component sensor histidine kinase
MLSTVTNQTAAFTLAKAVINASVAPLLLLDGEMRVVGASASFGLNFGWATEGLDGRFLSAVGGEAWNKPDMLDRLTATAAGEPAVDGWEMDFQRGGADPRRLVLSMQKLADPDPAAIWLLVTVDDVTEARARLQQAEHLLREKSVLLQELQHRTANSLQVVASLLLQSARKVQDTDARSHLTGAHGRLMSIAGVQRQLATSTLGAVALRPYLEELCKGLSGSMIPDPERTSIHLDCVDAMVSARESTSLGLIVTEAVINAVKHAFPNGRSGEIRVSYALHGGDWELCITDDGVGLPQTPAIVGLGSDIIQALATQLGAKVTVANANPGLTLRVARAQEQRSVKVA